MAKRNRPSGRKVRAALMAKQGCRCCYCAVDFAGDRPANRLCERYPTVEHIEDRARGGVNAQHNLALACHACNQRAGKERWSPDFKRAKIRAANIIDLADLEVEHMELPPLYLAQIGRAA